MPSSFDHAATTYDHDFTHTDLGRWLRGRVWKRLTRLFPSGSFVLELGCGTGEDAVWLAQQGVRVLATDASPVMLEQTQAKADAAGVEVETALLDLNALPAEFAYQFDGVYSNFGPLNCTRDWAGLARFLHPRLKPNARLGVGVMSPFCLWETLWHGVHLDFKTATRRWKRHTTATLPDGATFPVYYPSPRQLASALAPYFQQTAILGLGVFLPPSDSFGVIEKRPHLAQRLMALEQRWASRWPFRTWADHYWMELTWQPNTSI